jgi:hypothetical protein
VRQRKPGGGGLKPGIVGVYGQMRGDTLLGSGRFAIEILPPYLMIKQEA